MYYLRSCAKIVFITRTIFILYHANIPDNQYYKFNLITDLYIGNYYYI